MRPTVASYCTTFLKPEMRHIYRQVTGLAAVRDLCAHAGAAVRGALSVSTRWSCIPRARKNFLKRFFLKYIRRLPPVYYRGELQVIIKLLERRPADLMHIYFGHTGVHLLPFIKEWEQPGGGLVSRHGYPAAPGAGGLRRANARAAADRAAGARALAFAHDAARGDGLPAGAAAAESHGHPARGFSAAPSGARRRMARGGWCRRAGSSRRKGCAGRCRPLRGFGSFTRRRG